MIKESNGRMILTLDKSIINDFEIEAKREKITKSELMYRILKELGYGKKEV